MCVVSVPPPTWTIWTHPHIVLLVVASAGDSPLLIKLINAVRVFRVVFRPVKPTIGKLYLTSAMRQAELIRDAPALLQTQKTHNSERATALFAGFGQRLLSIKSIFTRSELSGGHTNCSSYRGNTACVPCRAPSSSAQWHSPN